MKIIALIGNVSFELLPRLKSCRSSPSEETSIIAQRVFKRDRSLKFIDVEVEGPFHRRASLNQRIDVYCQSHSFASTLSCNLNTYRFDIGGERRGSRCAKFPGVEFDRDRSWIILISSVNKREWKSSEKSNKVD